MDTFWQDVKYSLRTLRKNPGFTAVAVLTLALGIGANTTIFSVVDAVLLRALPYKSPEQLVTVWGKFDKVGVDKNWISEPEWWDLQDTGRAFSEMAISSLNSGANVVAGGGEPVRVSARRSSHNLFPMLGVQAARGRTFSVEEDQPGRNHVVLLSDGAWKSMFGADATVVGKSVRMDTQS